MKSSGFKMKGFSGFGNSPAKHDKSAGGHSEKYGKHTNEDHPDYWKAGKDGELSEKEMDLLPSTKVFPKGDVHPQQVKGYTSTLVPGSGTAHKYTYKKKKED